MSIIITARRNAYRARLRSVAAGTYAGAAWSRVTDSGLEEFSFGVNTGTEAENPQTFRVAMDRLSAERLLGLWAEKLGYVKAVQS